MPYTLHAVYHRNSKEIWSWLGKGWQIKSLALAFFFLIFFISPNKPLLALGKEVEIGVAYQGSQFIKSFPDPFYINEMDYIGSTATQGRLTGKFTNFFSQPFIISYQALSVKSHSENRGKFTQSITGYYSSYLSLMTELKTGIFQWHYGFAAFVTFGYRDYNTSGGIIERDLAVNNRLSQAYPSGGFTLFPDESLRFSMIFLSPDADLLYGWFRIQVEYDLHEHVLISSAELLNHESFGKGMPNFIQPPGAFALGYAYKLHNSRFGFRLGFVLNPLQGLNNAHILLKDRFIYGIAISHKFYPYTN